MGRLAKRMQRRVVGRVSTLNRQAENRYVTGLKKVMGKVHEAYMNLFDSKNKSDAKSPERLAYEKAVAERKAERAVRPLASEYDLLGVRVTAAIPQTVAPIFDKMAAQVKGNNAVGMRIMGITPTDIGLAPHVAAARDANIQLIEKAHRVYAQDVRDIMENPDNFGLSVEDLKLLLLERGSVSESRAELIARDQTLKLNGQMTKVRQQNAGVDSYTWSTSLDDRVREEHAALEGQVFRWDNPPEPGNPGDDYQCRCVAIAVIAELEGDDED